MILNRDLLLVVGGLVLFVVGLVVFVVVSGFFFELAVRAVKCV